MDIIIKIIQFLLNLIVSLFPDLKDLLDIITFQ